MSRSLVRRRLHRQPPPSYRILIALAAVAVFSFVGCTAVLVGGAGTAYAYISKDLPNPQELATRPLAQVTQLYDRTGQHLLYEFYEERRIYVPLDQISPVMRQATLAIEDANFYQHQGFDVQGLARSLINNVRSGEIVGGGSTITQQLVKRIFLSDEQTPIRKARELALAVQVERLYPKDQILELYLNQVYYGNQAYGVEAAALSYFGKHAKDLTLPEASLLAGLVQLPSRYDPVVNPQAALERQQQVLDQMVRSGMVTAEEAAAAHAQAATFTYRQQETQIQAPHFAFFVKEQLQQRVNPEVLRNGLKVITTLDLEAQNRAHDIVRRRVNEIRNQRVNNGALVALTPQTGEILAMVGSYDYYNQAIDGQVNVATAMRQPGSSFKAFTYAAAFATRRWAPSTTVVDQPISRPDPASRGGRYVPGNYDGKFHGTVTLRSALANSYNIPALLVQEAVTTREVVNMARRLGITADLPEVPSLTLGAGTVRLLDMTAAYGVFANGGVRVEPTPFLKITDSAGRVIYEHQPKGEAVIPAEVAYQIADVLSDNAARRPMFGNVLDLPGGRPGAVKTGTTDDYKDSLTVGFTPSLVTGVWVGNTDNSAMAQVAGSLGAAPIWREFMDSTLRGQPHEPFRSPQGVSRIRACGVVDAVFVGTMPTCSIGPGSYTVTRPVQPVQPRPAQPAPQPTARPSPVLPPD
ncbi:MAG TPA: PBP1A family penicillin-binding protein [Chloroflexota bacterium]|nr:PBP1A family penicillin-binding protein [Chloroflexota bacterium]